MEIMITDGQKLWFLLRVL